MSLGPLVAMNGLPAWCVARAVNPEDTTIKRPLFHSPGGAIGVWERVGDGITH